MLRAISRYSGASNGVARRIPILQRFMATGTSFDTKWGADGKIEPHGGKILENMATPEQAKDLLSR